MGSLTFISFIKAIQFSGSKQQLVSQFVSKTRIRSRNNAEVALQMQNWDLEKALNWFHEHKNDDEYKIGAETEFDSNEKEPGKTFVLPFLKSRSWNYRCSIFIN